MAGIYYLAARPETVVSILNKGMLPDNLRITASYVKQSHLELFETPEAAVANSDSIKKNIFILQYKLSEGTSKYDIEYESQTEVTKISCSQIDVSSLQKIYVLNKSSTNLLMKLLNSTCPVEIIENADFYTGVKLVKDQSKFDENVLNPSTLVKVLKTGDLLGSRMQTLINTVNCVGVMGKGIAFAFKQRYPEMFDDYQKKCKKGEVKIGKPYLYPINESRLIINFPTKKDWRNLSELNYVEEGLIYLAQHAEKWGIKSLAVPPLGCGNGGLHWEDVRPLIMKYLGPLAIPIEIYEPFIALKPPKKGKRKEREKEAMPLHSFFQSKNITQNETVIEPMNVKHRKLASSENEIDYIYSEGNINAFHKGIHQAIGRLEVVKEGSSYWLNHIEVNKNYRRKGIGTHLLKKATEIFPKLQISLISSKEGYGKYKYRLNDEVGLLIEYCIARGIINKKINCCEPVPELPLSYIF